MFWDLTGSQLFVLADQDGRLLALHTNVPGFTKADAPAVHPALTLSKGDARDWWFGNGHLFGYFLQPIYFRSPEDNCHRILAVGYDIDLRVAQDAGRVASSRVASMKTTLVVEHRDRRTAPVGRRATPNRLPASAARREEIQLAAERDFATSVRLSSVILHR